MSDTAYTDGIIDVSESYDVRLLQSTPEKCLWDAMNDATELGMMYRLGLYDEFSGAHEARLLDPPFYVVN